jgi:hypothetical protein
LIVNPRMATRDTIVDNIAFESLIIEKQQTEKESRASTVKRFIHVDAQACTSSWLGACGVVVSRNIPISMMLSGN